MSERQKKLKNKENLIHARRIQLWQNENFWYQKFVLRLEEDKEEMQNLILFQTVTNWAREFVSERQKKLKNKEN